MSSGLVPPTELVIIGALIAAPGTVLLFGQATAPVGWVAQSAVNNAAIRLMGAGNFVGTAGASNLTALLSGGLSTDSHQLVVSEIPAHAHSYSDPGHAHVDSDAIQFGAQTGGSPVGNGANSTGTSTINITILNTGGDGGHTHGLTNFNIKYQDVIMATKS